MENLYIYNMTSTEVVDVNNETKTDEAPINHEVDEQNDTVNEEREPKLKDRITPHANFSVNGSLVAMR